MRVMTSSMPFPLPSERPDALGPGARVSGSTIIITASGSCSPAAPLTGSEAILGLGLAFMGSKALLSAVELDLFTVLAAGGPRTSTELAAVLGLHPRAVTDFLDALVSLGLLVPDELGEGERRYRNAADADRYLDRRRAEYVGGMLEMAGARLYPFWSSLTEGLRSGAPQNEMRDGGDVFGAIYADPVRLRAFLYAMTGTSLGIARALADVLPWSEHRHVIDVGGALGAVPAILLARYPHLSGGVFELPEVEPVFDEYVATAGLTDRIRFHGGDFFTDPLPAADVLVFGSILHDWGLDRKRLLLKQAYQALPPGGRIVIYDAMIDPGRRENTFGLLMSLNMLIETDTGFDYSTADAVRWLTEAGFAHCEVRHLMGGYSTVIALR